MYIDLSVVVYNNTEIIISMCTYNFNGLKLIIRTTLIFV